MGSRDGVIGVTAGRTGAGTEGSCRLTVPRCHEDEAAGSSSALPAEAWPQHGSRKAGVKTRLPSCGLG